MDPEKGRKAIGGKLEVRMRVREPLSEKDVKIEKWNWLVIDVHFGARQVRLFSLFSRVLGNLWLKY